MQQQAIEKLQAEMEANKSKPYVQVIGGYLVSYVQKNPDAATSILAKDKTITKSVAEMSKAAQKGQVDGVGVLTDEDGFGIVLKYFGIGSKTGEVPVERPVRYEQTSLFDLKLEDLL